MATPLAHLTLLTLHTLSLSSSTAPATGRHEVLLTVDTPGAIHVSATSSSGTACEIVDRVRGAFARAGSSGGTNCELDLVLDAGQYKLRLESPARGKGQVAISATPFTELNATPQRLTKGVGAVLSLKPRQQASFWLSFAERTRPYVRISGRHAGDVRLWRNGEWLEPAAIAHSHFSPLPGQPMHEWWVDTELEAGDYRLVVYGRNSTTVTGSSTDDSLTVEYGWRPAPTERTTSFTLGPSGVSALELPEQELAAILSLAASPSAGQVFLESYTRGIRNAQSTCRLDQKAQVPQCSLVVHPDGESSTPSVLLVRGPPGTQGTVSFAPWASQTPAWGGYYGPSTTSLPFNVRSPGKYFVGVDDFPHDTDSAPLGCQLEELKGNGELARVVARSALKLNEGEMLERAFNFPSDGVAIWFEIAAPESMMKRVGLSSRRFRVSVTEKGACEVYRLSEQGDLKRLTQAKPEAAGCNELIALDPGFYQLQLPAGQSAIRTLTIKEEGVSNPSKTSATGTCVFAEQQLNSSRYRVTLSRLGDVVVRALNVTPSPLVQSVHFTLDAKQKLTLPLAPTNPLLVRAALPLGCTSTSGHVASSPAQCEIAAGVDTLSLSNPNDTPVAVSIEPPPAPLPAHNAPTAFTPSLKPLPRLTFDKPMFFDFAANEAHSAVFDVETPGLYNITTQGLLRTACILRTPTIDSVVQDAGSGRGNNCLLQTWLQKGRYLVTASTQQASSGRAALLVTRRNAREVAAVAAENNQFFRVDANELVQQKLVVKNAGQYTLATTTQGTNGLGCRLDDPDGWPLDTVPTACSATRELRAGTWLWSQLPLTVESMRHTSLMRLKEPVVLKGNKPHALEFFTWYTAELGSDGKDEFSFALEGEAQLDVVLTAGMQGRVYRLEADKPPKPVEIIAPQETQPDPQPDENTDESSNGDEAPTDDSEASDSSSDTSPSAARLAESHAAPPPPAGAKITLPQGRYSIITEHSRGDVGVTYQLHLGSTTMMPGMARELPTPSTVAVVVPRDGTLRLRTSGDADVRCRLLDEKGRLVFESADNGADWNCAAAEPITKGRYTLVLESETQQPGTSRLALEMPPVDDKGLIADGKLTLNSSVTSWRLPVAEKDSIIELSLTSQNKTPLSCALENAQAQVVARRSRVGDCTLLVRPKLDTYRLRAWTTDGSVPISVATKTRPIVEGSAGDAPVDKALAVTLPRAGRYRTAQGLFCIAAHSTGPLRACGPETSFESGVNVISASGAKPVRFALDEVTATGSTEAALSVALTVDPYVQTWLSDRPAVMLLQARVRYGERVAPSCAFDQPGSVRERRDDACFAASVGTSATARLWAPSDTPIETQLTRTSLILPENSTPLSAGHQRLTFSRAGRFALPKNARSRLELVLPKNAWAVLLDEQKAAIDLCAPTGEMRRCVLTGQQGSVVISGAEGVAEVTTLVLEGTARTVAFSGLYEELPRQPGTLRLAVDTAATERMATIEGATRCTVALADGTRLTTCRARLPPNTKAELIIDYDASPFRAMVHPVGRDKWARLSLEVPVMPATALPPAVAVALEGNRVDRMLVVDAESVVRIASDNGVCGLFRGNDVLAVDGLDKGCEIIRVLSPGTYRLLARPFAGTPLSGLVRWVREPVAQLSEGVGAEAWLAPGDVRLYRFDTANAGKLGLGIQANSEVLDCAVYNDGYQLLGEGCHQYLTLPKGRFLLTVRNPSSFGGVPRAFKPVLLGLTGESNDIPQEFLQDFFRRVEVNP